ncbi:hypothetical protein F2Q69_00050501 [Brassica cretica]|uniref:Uncharacterized protein n=1 Tax=Brassica cretica TaxID=69181 RepID=A0A8S9PV03_BRACR|nr:hypothetical protein F2Q69_00050501 [Brassica cretica]
MDPNMHNAFHSHLRYEVSELVVDDDIGGGLPKTLVPRSSRKLPKKELGTKMWMKSQNSYLMMTLEESTKNSGCEIVLPDQSVVLFRNSAINFPSVKPIQT